MKKLLMSIMIMCASSLTFCQPNLNDELFGALDQTGGDGQDFIHYLASLIERGANVNARTSDNMTPLMVVASGQMVQGDEILEFLVAQGADVNARDNQKRNALDYALEQNADINVKTLMKLGAKPTIDNLIRAVPFVEMLKVLIPGCQNLQERDSWGYSFLHWATSCSYESTKLLIDNNVDVHIRNLNGGSTVLHTVFNSLVTDEHGIDQTPVSEKKLIISYLLDKGLSISAERAHDQTPLHDLMLSGQIANSAKIELIEFMLSVGADPLKKDRNGLSPLHYEAHHARLTENNEVLDGFIAAIKKYRPRDSSAAELELSEDIEQVEEAHEKRNRLRSIASWIYWAGLNGLALYGVFEAANVLRKQKTH